MADFAEVFDALRRIMLKHAEGLVIARDDPGHVEIRTGARDPKSGQAGWFGTVTIKKSYAAYHLIPLYDHPDLAADLSPTLEKRRQGKTCFNFKTVAPDLLVELETLTARVRAVVDG